MHKNNAPAISLQRAAVMSKNEITGDEIKTKHSNSYADNFDSIFRKDIKRSLAILEAMNPDLFANSIEPLTVTSGTDTMVHSLDGIEVNEKT